jgi:hypothetical protein
MFGEVEVVGAEKRHGQVVAAKVMVLGGSRGEVAEIQGGM